MCPKGQTTYRTRGGLKQNAPIQRYTRHHVGLVRQIPAAEMRLPCPVTGDPKPARPPARGLEQQFSYPRVEPNR
jgi:hypothetical protein